MKKFFACLICGSMFAFGSCLGDGLKLATGTGLDNQSPYAGVDVELVDGFDFFVPVVPLAN